MIDIRHFFSHSIIGEDDETFSPVDDVITATSYGFSFDSFMFRGSGSRVYIKCNIHVCEFEDIKNNRDACSIPVSKYIMMIKIIKINIIIIIITIIFIIIIIIIIIVPVMWTKYVFHGSCISLIL